LSDRLTPEQAVRLLRAKVGEYENFVKTDHRRAEEFPTNQRDPRLTYLTADLALVMDILASYIEDRMTPESTRGSDAEDDDPRYAPAGHVWVTKSGKVLTDEDIQALADEAEQGYDVSHLKDKPDRRRRSDEQPGR
jgi:hypothetical protein